VPAVPAIVPELATVARLLVAMTTPLPPLIVPELVIAPIPRAIITPTFEPEM
jgi:hypothetical protein